MSKSIVLEFSTPGEGHIKITTSSDEFAEKVIEQFTNDGYILMSVREKRDSFFRDVILSKEFVILIIVITVVCILENILTNK